MKKTLKHLSYAMGNFANTIAYQVFGNRIQFYYVDILGLNAATAGILWTIYGLWNAVNDPLMGQLSDRTRSKFGRRVPYVAFGAIPLGLSFFFLWTPPGKSAWLLAAYFLIVLFIFDTLYSLTFIAYNSLFPEVAPNVRDRVDLSTVREILGTIALLLSYILAPILAGSVGYVWMGAIMGALVGIGYLISMLGIKEAPIDDKEVQLGMRESLKIVLSSLPFRWFLGANIAKEYIWLALGAMLPFWRKYVLSIQAPVNFFGAKLGPGRCRSRPVGACHPACHPLLIDLASNRAQAWLSPYLDHCSSGVYPWFISDDDRQGFLFRPDRHITRRARSGRLHDPALPRHF